MILLILYVLGVLDSALSGIREAGGRSALLDKRSFYWQSVRQGLLVGHAGLAASVALGVAIVSLSPAPSQLLADLQTCGYRLLEVYVPYSFILIGSFAVRLVPSVDLRSFLSMVIFGPFSFIRPAVAILGVIWAWSHTPRWEAMCIGVFTTLSMLSVEYVIGWWRLRAPHPGTSTGWTSR